MLSPSPSLSVFTFHCVLCLLNALQMDYGGGDDDDPWKREEEEKESSIKSELPEEIQELVQLIFDKS